MNNIKNLILVLLIAVTAFSCKNETQPETKIIDTEVEVATTTLDPNAKYAKAEFKIDGMTCAVGCAAKIEKKMANMEGVKSAKVDFDRRLAMVEYDEAKVTPANLETTVTSVADAYKVKEMKAVDAFSKNGCKADCKKDCCKNKTNACKASCDKDCCKGKADKKACAADCSKSCCKGEGKKCAEDCKKACCTKAEKA